MHNFTPALKTLVTDSRGRINIGTVVSDAKGRSYGAAVDAQGRILLTPVALTEQARHDRAVEVPRG